ncbi:MAG: S-layer homology domain-containing protein [Oscillospiraceae bacterium]|nr:S-layer homology domain-containing protein [Oscillospiraceae bacterium]
MRKLSNRFLPLLLAAAMLLSLLTFSASANSLDLTQIADNEDEGLGQLYTVQDIISLSEDAHHTVRIPLEGTTYMKLSADIAEGNVTLSLDRDTSHPYLDSTLYPNAKAGGTMMDGSVWQTQNRTALFQNIEMKAETEEDEVYLIVDFDSVCYFYGRGGVDYSAPHSNGGAYLDLCGWFKLTANVNNEISGFADVKVAPYKNYRTMPEIYTEIHNMVQAANENGLYAFEDLVGYSTAGREIPYLVIADSKATVDAWMALTRKAEADPTAVLADIAKGVYNDIRVPILYSNIHSNEIAATDGILQFGWALANAGIDGKFSYNMLTGFTDAGKAQLEEEMNDPSRSYYGNDTAAGVAVPDLIKDKATYLGYLQDGNGRSGKVDLDKYYTQSENEISVKDMLSGVFFVLVPEENVDGRTYDTRTASNGYDLNRDNSFQTTSETASMQRLIGSYNPVSFTEFHGRVTDFQCEPCDPPHEPNFEYDLLAEHLVTGGEYFGIAAVANNASYNSYVIPQRDYLSKITGDEAHDVKWFDPWDDMSTSYTPQFAMLHGTVAYTVELPAYSDDTTDLVKYGCIGQADYIMQEKLGYLTAQVKIFERGVTNANSDAYELVGQWFCDQYDVEGAEMDVFRPEYTGEGQNGNFYPECYIIPLDRENQSNLAAAVEMMVWLTRNHVKVNLTEAEFTYGGVTYPAGTMIVSMYQAKRSVANGALYDGTLIQGWPTLYSEGITSFNETRGFDMATVAEPASYQTIAAVMGEDIDYESVPYYAMNVRSSFEGVRGADVIISNVSEDSTYAVNLLLQEGKTVGMITEGEYKGDFICKYADFRYVASEYIYTLPVLTATGVYGKDIKAQVIEKPVVYITGVPSATTSGGCIATSQVGNASWNYDRVAMELMGFEVTEDVSEANVIAGCSGISGAALEAAQAGTPYIGYSSGAMRNASSVVPGFTRTGLPGAMDCLAYVTYPNETLVNASYISEGDDVMYGYGFGYFSAIPEGAVALVKTDGSKTPTEGFIPAISDRAKQTYEAFLDGGVLGFSYDDGTVHAALFANTLTQKGHQRDEYAYISNFIFSSLLGDAYQGLAEGDPLPDPYVADLNTAIADAEEMDVAKYPASLVAAFQKALADAKAAKDSKDQNVVDNAFYALDEAMGAIWNFQFDDVSDPSQYYYDPVYWAFDHNPQITKGTSDTKFSPDAGCTRAQAVTFLWRAAGEPEPASSTNPFEDVIESDYYYKAVLWAVEKGITTGTSATTFRPDHTCTRAQIVTFLWRNADKPEPSSSTNPFTDVKDGDYFAKAVLWAVENGITTGTSATTFRPENTCTRAQIVTFLYRALSNVVIE